jgi:hypothetical protein
MAERPTTLEITEAQGMIARFSGFEQLAAAYMFGQPLRSTDPGQPKAAATATRLETALAAWEIQAHRTLAANRIQPTWCGSPACRHSSPAPQASSPKPRHKGHIDDDVMQRLGRARGKPGCLSSGETLG